MKRGRSERLTFRTVLNSVLLQGVSSISSQHRLERVQPIKNMAQLGSAQLREMDDLAFCFLMFNLNICSKVTFRNLLFKTNKIQISTNPQILTF